MSLGTTVCHCSVRWRMDHLTRGGNDRREATQNSVDGCLSDIEKFRGMAIEIKESYYEGV